MLTDFNRVINNITTNDQHSNLLYALYIHVPFCQTRCTYCAFNTYAGLQALIQPYTDALLREITLVAGEQAHPVHTVYFGGGTPSLVPAERWGEIVTRCRAVFSVSPDVEITLEANPGTVDEAYLARLRAVGINRLSMGMQSAHAAELRLFGRRHTLDDVRAGVRAARAAGFTQVSLDLIYGAPRQTLTGWQASVETALSMAPDHLSFYDLGIEEGTPMHHWLMRGKLPQPDPDLAADMYEWASERLAAAGFEQYEISNWARPGSACRHNIHYWRNLSYLGLGAGAHGFAAGVRYANVRHPAAYIERIQAQAAPFNWPLSAAVDEYEAISTRQAMAETMITGLRLTVEGVACEAFARRFGCDLWSVYGQELDRLIAVGLLELTADQHVRLTPRGRLLGNRVFVAFVEGD